MEVVTGTPVAIAPGASGNRDREKGAHVLVRFDFTNQTNQRSTDQLASASVVMERGDGLLEGVVIHGFDLWNVKDGAPQINITTRKAAASKDSGTCFGMSMQLLRRTILVALIQQQPEVIARLAGFEQAHDSGSRDLREVA